MRCEQEISVGAYLLDALEPDEQLRMEEHVAQCPSCREAVDELVGVPPLLAGISPPVEAPKPPAPSEFAYQRLRSAAVPKNTAPSGRRRSWRALAVAAAAVAVIGGGVVAGVEVTSDDRAPVPTAVSASANGVSARAAIAPAESGSRITLTVDGVPLGERCRLEVVGKDGAWDASRWWSITRPGELSWTYTVSVAPSDLDRLDVVGSDGRTLVTLRT